MKNVRVFRVHGIRVNCILSIDSVAKLSSMKNNLMIRIAAQVPPSLFRVELQRSIEFAFDNMNTCMQIREGSLDIFLK